MVSKWSTVLVSLVWNLHNGRMILKLYQVQVLAGVLLAVVMEGLFMTSGPYISRGIAASVQAASFLLCCAGIMKGGRELRSAFEVFGSDKSLARRDRIYMRMRGQLQITSVAAVAAMGLVAARRSGIADVIPLLAAAALGLSLPLINRLSGWVTSG